MNLTVYSNHNIQKAIISICKDFYIHLFSLCVTSLKSPMPFTLSAAHRNSKLALFQLLSSHTWQVAAILEGAGLGDPQGPYHLLSLEK